MDFFDVLSLIGGLSLFLYGMSVMGDGLKKLSGGKLESILARLTSNKFMAVLLGLGVTAIIQSSSATTVMVVGFVNSGIMKLHQAVGIIMGANIGTTVTSWILSLSGIQGDSFFVRMLKPSSFSPILALIGIIFLMFCKSDKKKDIGGILLGFAILMFGMETMSSSVAGLKEEEGFTSILTMFSDNPILGMLAGTVLTAIIQSSSASVGILQALCTTGAISFGTVIPIIMGQNIGTCVTALLSSIGASKNAKRTAFVHLYFNLIGTIIFMVCFYSINAFVHFSFLANIASPAGIAVVHSLFNIGTVIVLFPFSSVLEKLAILSIRDKADEDENGDAIEEALRQLDERFLDKPAFALMQAKSATVAMANLSEEALHEASALIFEYSDEVAEKVKVLEDRVDKYEDAIGKYLTKLAAGQLSGEESRRLTELQHCVGDFERISDISLSLVHGFNKMVDKEQSFSPKAIKELEVLSNAVKDMTHSSVESFANNDVKIAKNVEPLEECIDDLSKEIEEHHRKRLKKGKCSVDMGFVLSDVTTDLERIGDHCNNVALSVIRSEDKNIEAHEYVRALDKNENDEYQAMVLHYKEKYALKFKEA